MFEVKENTLDLVHDPEEHTLPTDSSSFLKKFREGFELNVLERPSEDELVFELINVDVSFANALRRILISEVPTMAFERIYIMDNTSIVHDEVLAHRLGLIPLKVDARLFEFYPDGHGRNDGDDDHHDDDDVVEDEKGTDRNTIVFNLSVTCGEPPSQKTSRQSEEADDAAGAATLQDTVVGGNPDLMQAARDASALRRQATETPDCRYTEHVYSGQLEWVGQGNQAEIFGDSIRPVHDDILIAKLRPGQTIELEAHARKGIGKDHAKYSPVATASYRLMPKIELVEDVYDDLARELVMLYEPGVFELIESDTPGTQVKARVCNPRACTMSRNFTRHPTLSKAIKMTRIPNHFIFVVESVGMVPPAVLVSEAIKVLREKCKRLSELLEKKGREGTDEK